VYSKDLIPNFPVLGGVDSVAKSIRPKMFISDNIIKLSIYLVCVCVCVCVCYYFYFQNKNDRDVTFYRVIQTRHC